MSHSRAETGDAMQVLFEELLTLRQVVRTLGNYPPPAVAALHGAILEWQWSQLPPPPHSPAHYPQDSLKRLFVAFSETSDWMRVSDALKNLVVATTGWREIVFTQQDRFCGPPGRPDWSLGGITAASASVAVGKFALELVMEASAISDQPFGQVSGERLPEVTARLSHRFARVDLDATRREVVRELALIDTERSQPEVQRVALLSYREAAHKLGCKAPRISQLVKEGKLESASSTGGRVDSVTAESLELYKASKDARRKRSKIRAQERKDEVERVRAAKKAGIPVH